MERWGEPEDVSEMASFLISNKASFITGQGFVLDGGVSLLKNI
jgi:NAD(P)-dependent dehydrogenase (short-subunit alcohol dehydrogenase family)